MAGGKRGSSKPAAPAKAPEARKKAVEQDKLSEQDIYEVDFELDSPQEGGHTGDFPQGRGEKRPRVEEDVGATPSCGNEMQSLIAGFGMNVSKTLDAKRKRLETLTQASLKTTNVKVEKIWKTQQTERQHLADEYKHQSTAVLNQWDADIQKSKEAEEKLSTMFKQQQKLFQQQRVVQTQRLKTIKQLHEQFDKSATELDACHHKQQVSVQTELKKEMGLLQKKLLMETQNQEISNVRRSLQSMLAQV